jgi:hypothetical protein
MPLTFLSFVAVIVCVALLFIPGVVWGAVFTFTLLGHLTQFVFKKDRWSNKR